MTAIRLLEPSGSNGSIQFSLDGDFSSSSGLVFVTGSERLGVGTDNPNAKLHVVGGTIWGDSASDLHQVTGSAVFATGLSGSLTQLADGRSYLVAGPNVSIVTSSDGQITISAGGSGYGSASEISKMSWMETPAGTVDGVNMVFTLTHPPTPNNSLMFYVNGVLQSPGSIKDYTLASDTIITNFAPISGSQIVATYSYVTVPESGANISWMEIPSGVIDGSNSYFGLQHVPHPPTSLMLYYNGVLQRQGLDGDYVVVGGKNFVTAFTPEIGSNLSATYPY